MAHLRGIVTQALAPVLTPHGRLLLAPVDDAPALAPDQSRRIEESFARGSGHGLLRLGAAEVGSVLPPVFGYWREFSARFVTAVCTLSDAGDRGVLAARTFWGKAWCDSLERYSDYANRLPRGRTYIRNGSVVDLQIAPGRIGAMVSGSDLYRIEVKVAAVTKARWTAICRDCAGAIDSLVELLQGRLSPGVMARMCQEKTGLFPSPAEIAFTCSCPDWASMCKHVAAVLYGIGARLDEQPDLLFALRKVDQQDLIARAGKGLAQTGKGPKAAKVLGESDLSEMFGIEIAQPAKPQTAAVRNKRASRMARR